MWFLFTVGVVTFINIKDVSGVQSHPEVCEEVKACAVPESAVVGLDPLQ